MSFSVSGFAIRFAPQDAVLHQGREAVGEQGSRAADVGEKLLKPVRTIERLADHQQSPLLAHDVEGALDRAVAYPYFLEGGQFSLLDVAITSSHRPILAEFDNTTQTPLA